MESEQAAEVIREMMDYVLEFAENALLQLQIKPETVIYTGIFADEKTNRHYAGHNSALPIVEDGYSRRGHQQRRSDGSSSSTLRSSTSHSKSDHRRPSPLFDESGGKHEELFIGDKDFTEDGSHKAAKPAIQRSSHKLHRRSADSPHAFSSVMPSNFNTPPLSPPITSSVRSPISSAFSSGTRITFASDLSESECTSSGNEDRSSPSGSSITGRKHSSSIITPTSPSSSFSL